MHEGFSPGKKNSARGELKTGCSDNQIQPDSLNYLRLERLMDGIHIQFSFFLFFFFSSSTHPRLRCHER